MTTTQRPRPQRPPTSAPNPASRGVILVVVAVVVGVILLVKGGGVGFEPTSNELEIATEDTAAETVDGVTTTTETAPATSVPPAALKVVALNGAGINGYAALSQQFLGVAGYSETTVGTAANQTPTTIVYFAPGFEVDAATLAGLFGLDPAAAVQPLPTDASLARDAAEVPADANVVVLLGPDVQNTIEGAAANDVPEDAATTSETG